MRDRLANERVAAVSRAAPAEMTPSTARFDWAFAVSVVWTLALTASTIYVLFFAA